LPARHPAERGDDIPSSSDTPPSGDPAAPTNPSSQSSSDSSASPEPTSESTPDANAVNANKDRGIRKLLKPVPCLGGLRATTILVFVAQVTIVVGSIVGWVFTGNKLKEYSNSGGDVPGGKSGIVFIHVIFCLFVIGQLVFVERRVYRMRAERYAYLHPGEVLPSYRNRLEPGGDLSFAYAPWNRPPLPTYAAVLVQSGYGTGDVDDHLIAVPPPPAYGNTRGSTLLLSGFLRDSLRAQRPPSVNSEADIERGTGERGGEERGTSDGSSQRRVSRGEHIQQTMARLERTDRS